MIQSNVLYSPGDVLRGPRTDGIGEPVDETVEMFGRVPWAKGENDVAEEELTSGPEHAADVLEPDGFPQVGQVMEGGGGDGCVEVVGGQIH